MTHIGILFMKKVAQTPGVRKKEYLGTVHKPRGNFRGGVRPSVHTGAGVYKVPYSHHRVIGINWQKTKLRQQLAEKKVFLYNFL